MITNFNQSIIGAYSPISSKGGSKRSGPRHRKRFISSIFGSMRLMKLARSKKRRTRRHKSNKSRTRRHH